jgi:hypothetical protein
MRAAHADTPNLAYPPEWRLPTTDVKPLARSKCRRRRRGAPTCRRRARGGGHFPVLLPLRACNRLWFGPSKHSRVGRSMANRRSINSKTLPKWVYYLAGKDSVRTKSGFAHTMPSSILVQSGRANDTPYPVSQTKEPRVCARTAHAETPRHRNRPGEYTPHVRSYPAHAYPIQNVSTALQSAHSGRHAFSR